MIAQCVECDDNVELGSLPRVGMKVTCHSCGARLEIVSLEPAEVDWAYEEDDGTDDEEWDDDDDDLDDDDAVLAVDLDDFDDDDDLGGDDHAARAWR